mmetsp:Transcript_7051/g.20837  ORF Transcript_7051/g.20837 Transcript_7051/m.20837 type:complete len:175 (+) Transcript_7051:2-526(+)
MIAGYLQELVAMAAKAGIPFVAHVDGPFWAGCPTAPCPDWDVGGFSPGSLRAGGVAGVMAESWAQGNLGVAAAELIRQGGATASTLQMLCDVPNCDLSARPCSTGNVDSDNDYWFRTINALGLSSWGVWDLIDGGVGDPNEYGDVLNNGSGLTRKGQIHAAHARAASRSDLRAD